MLTRNDAQAIALQYISKIEADVGESLELLKSETLVKHFGWVFFYNSKAYVDTGLFKHQLAGNAPFIVDTNGTVHQLGTAQSVEESIASYEKGLQDMQDA